MATQTVEYICTSGQTVTAKLFEAGSDTEVASEAGTEETNRKTVYLSDFTDIPAGTYRLIAFNASNAVLAAWWVTLTLTTATFVAYEMPIGLIGSQSSLDTILTEIQKIPRLGTTHKHRQVASSAVAKSADVIIEAAP